ncbi:MAG: guanylate kinase [Parachlamydiales bacterium]|jgi:guanylate kinase
MQKVIGNLSKGLFFIISAPSGTGKTTLIRMLTKECNSIVESVSFTTRKPRKGEIEGIDYFFISEEEFEEKIKNNEFLEYAKVFGNYYGTSKSFVEQNLKDKKHIVLIIDTQGAMKLKGKIDAVYVFISPPSIEELRSRINFRNSNDEDDIKKRLEWSKEEMKLIKEYDYNIVNHDSHTSYEILKAIIIAEEHKVKNLNYWR